MAAKIDVGKTAPMVATLVPSELQIHHKHQQSDEDSMYVVVEVMSHIKLAVHRCTERGVLGGFYADAGERVGDLPGTYLDVVARTMLYEANIV